MTLANNSDIERAGELARFLFRGDWYRYVVVKGDPKSKARPRLGGKGHVYSPSKPDQDAVAAAIKPIFPAPIDGSLAIGCVFFRPNKQRIDADNMMKLVMDAATGVCWHDDSQVSAQLGIVEFDPLNPRTIVVIGPRDSSMVRSAATAKKCATCGTEFRRPSLNAKFCSRICASLSRGDDLRAAAKCSHCNSDFKRRTVGQRYCSDQCRLSALTGKRRAAAKPLPNCAACGKQLSKHGYGLCRSCWRTAR